MASLRTKVQTSEQAVEACTIFEDEKCPSQPSEGTLLLVLFLYLKESGTNTTAKQYANDLQRLLVSVKKKRPWKLTSGAILQHDNARLHVAQMVQDLLSRMD